MHASLKINKLRRLFVGLTAVAAAAAATSSFAQLSDDAVRARVDALMARMTLEESRADHPALRLQEVPKEEERAAKGSGRWRGGSVLLLKTAAGHQPLPADGAQDALGIPLLVGFDVIHGFHTVMPVPLAMAASWDPPWRKEAQTVAAREARAVGIHWTFCTQCGHRP